MITNVIHGRYRLEEVKNRGSVPVSGGGGRRGGPGAITAVTVRDAPGENIVPVGSRSGYRHCQRGVNLKRRSRPMSDSK